VPPLCRSKRNIAAFALSCLSVALNTSARAQDAGVEPAFADAGALQSNADAQLPAADDAGAPAQADAGETTPAAAPAPSAPLVPAPSATTPIVPAASAPFVAKIGAPADASASEASAAPAATEVTVVGTKLARTAGSAHVLRRKELERWEYDDVTKVLQSVPGVYLRTEDGMGLRPNIGIRGVDPDRSKKITLLEDGILFGPAPYSAPAAYFFPLVTRMDKLRVVKGPGTVANGPNTVGGSIDFITRPIPSKLSAGADIAAGQYGYGKADVYAGTSTEQVGFLIEGVRLQNNGFKELPNGADTGFIKNEWMVKGSYIVDPHAAHKNEFNLKLTYSDEVSNESYLGITDQDFKKNPNQRYFASQLDRMENHRTSIVLNHLLTWSPKLSLSTTAYRHDFHRTWRKVNGFRGADINSILLHPNEPSYRPFIDVLHGIGTGDTQQTILIGPNQRTFVSQGLDSRLRFDAETGPVSHRLEVGARYHFDSIDRRHSQNGFLVDDGELIPDGNPTEVWAFNRAATHAVSLHAVYAVTWKGLTLTPGVRAELIRSSLKNRLDDTTKRRFVSAILPGVGAYYAITNELGVLAGVYRGFTPPPPGSGKDNNPENSVNYEGGARYTRGALRLEAIGFFNDYRNFTSLGTEESTAVGSLDQQYDYGRARIYGAEVSGEHEIPAGPVKLPVLLAYTFTRSELLNDVVSNDPLIGGRASAGDEMPYLPRHQLRFSAGVEHPRAGGNIALNYVGAMRSQAGSGSAAQARMDGKPFTDAGFIVDASAAAKIWRTISIYLTLQNVFNTQYITSRRPFGARPNAPRWLQVGLKGSY
jgi:Fe(3+) dicitrate transport protein